MRVVHGECVAGMAALEEASVHAVVTDPPYHLTDPSRSFRMRANGIETSGGDPARSRKSTGFMGKAWDGGDISFRPETWAACLRVAKPGAYLVAFGATRTWHRIAVAIEDGGWEIRDTLCWLHGQGFPKSLDVSKAIDKAAGATREVIGGKVNNSCDGNPCKCTTDNGRYGKTVHSPATAPATAWDGWGTALKPAFEPIILARKPLGGTVAANVLAHGTGALNIDGCRVEGPKPDTTRGASVNASSMAAPLGGQGRILDDGKGRWPANVVLDESQAAALDEQSGDRPGDNPNRKPRQNTAEAHNRTVSMGRATEDWTTTGHADIGGASRFFYVAKADASERPRVNGTAHPTVKPLDLMRWLVRLVTPPGGTVLEPFAGSGTTVEACIVEGFQCIAIEREADYLPLIRQRIDRRRDPVEALRGQAADLGLFDLLGGEGA